MEIKVKSIKNCINDLNKIINNYENDLINANKNLLDVDAFWHGEKSVYFSDKINIEQRKTNNVLSELHSFVSIYNYIANEYSKLGNNIKFHLKRKEIVNKSIDGVISEANKIIKLYNEIPARYAYLIQGDKRYFSKLIETAKYVKSRYNLICDKISNIESNTKAKISKFNIELIQESDIKNLM